MRIFTAPACFSRAYTFAYGTCLALGVVLLTAAGRPNLAPPRLNSARSTVTALSPDTTAYRLRGRLLDAYTQEPLPAAALWLKQLALGAHSDEQGYFAFELTADQLAAAPTDTLQVQAHAFRLQNLPITFLQQPADSLLRLVVQRDSIVAQPKPLPALRRREVRQLGKPSARPLRASGH